MNKPRTLAISQEALAACRTAHSCKVIAGAEGPGPKLQCGRCGCVLPARVVGRGNRQRLSPGRRRCWCGSFTPIW